MVGIEIIHRTLVVPTLITVSTPVARNLPTHGVYMICMVMFGNGIMIGIILTAAAHKPTPVVILQARTACFAVVVGASLLRACAQRSATKTVRVLVTDSSGFASS